MGFNEIRTIVRVLIKLKKNRFFLIIRNVCVYVYMYICVYIKRVGLIKARPRSDPDPDPDPDCYESRYSCWFQQSSASARFILPDCIASAIQSDLNLLGFP